MLKPGVHDACTRLGRMVGRRGAEVAYVYLPSGEGGAKVGVDDFLAGGKSLADVTALAAPELREPLLEHEEDAAGPGRTVAFSDPSARSRTGATMLSSSPSSSAPLTSPRENGSAGGSVTIARGRASGVEVDGRWGYLISVENGQIVRIEAYRDARLALKMAGVGGPGIGA
jgi:hypothetical protein